MTGRLLRTVRCPECGQLPDLVISPAQAFCGNDDCRVLQFDPTQDAAAQIAGGVQIPPLTFPAEMAQEAAAERGRQVVGSAADDVREAETRDYYHRNGYVCADGRCTVCG